VNDAERLSPDPTLEVNSLQGLSVPEPSIIVPTLNERDNVAVLVEAVDRALAGVDYEIVFVDDDSDDGTATSAPYLAVMDGDMQHDECILPRMLHALRTSDVDLVVGTRNIAGGGVKSPWSPWSKELSGGSLNERDNNGYVEQ